VKTSTGFNGPGARVEDVVLLRAVVGEQLGVKASGGIRTAAQARALIAAGASRLGASSSLALLEG
jgi:deoxyribose-phosphate aldolase